VPILGLGVLAEGVIRFGVMLFNKQVRKEANRPDIWPIHT
jgi:hypothetical protein